MSNCSITTHLGGMTSAAFVKAARVNPVILLPLGSQEDHGPALPMGDYLLAELLAARIAEAAMQRGAAAYVAPALPFGVADYFGSSPGGMAISASHFRNFLSDILNGLLRQGLTRILILNGHSGNAPVIHEVTLEIKREKNIIIPSFYLWKVARGLMEKRQGPSHAACFGHGAEPLLSLSLALRPEHVKTAEFETPPSAEMLGLPVSGFGALDFNGIEINAPAEFGDVPHHAINAAIPLASAEMGTAVADELVEIAAKFIVHLTAAT